MRILLSYASEFDKGEGIHYARVLRRLGHGVHEVNVAATAAGTGSPGQLVRGYPADTSITELLYDSGGADLFLYLEPAGLIPLGLEHSPIPTACIFADVHSNVWSHLLVARLFDHVFSYMRNYVNVFRDHPPSARHWLPYGCDPTVYPDCGVERDLDVGFIGRLHTAERAKIIESIARRYRMNEQRYYLQSEVPGVYARAKIVVELPVADTIHFRLFEALFSGALLIAKRANGGEEELLTNGVHYVCVDDVEDLRAKLDYYLTHEAERKRIARQGHEAALRKHTLDGRLVQLLGSIAGGPKDSAPIRRMTKKDVLRIYARIYERAGRVETLLKMAGGARKTPWTRAELLGRSMKSLGRRMVLGW
jgi:hypothetical protein